MIEIIDPHLGPITISKNKNARRLSIRITPQGKLRLTCPYRTTKLMLRLFIKQNRQSIAEMVNKYTKSRIYKVGDLIGKHHKIKTEPASKLKVILRNNYLVVQLPNNLKIEDAPVQNEIKKVVIKALRKQAKAYLPRRLAYLAKKYDFDYVPGNLSHASTRWGSCGTDKKINLNIALMNLDHELIDYVIIHELCHTRQMNHSRAFWQEVENILPNYKQLVRKMKKHSPYV